MRNDPLAFLSTELESLKSQGLYRHLRVLEGEQKPKTTFDHRQVVNLSSNNYLGLTTHPKLRERQPLVQLRRPSYTRWRLPTSPPNNR